jgi:hypothetical protein
VDTGSDSDQVRSSAVMGDGGEYISPRSVETEEAVDSAPSRARCAMSYGCKRISSDVESGRGKNYWR